ncbi:hypothetical protein FPZ24_06660 [Sphingomonas panacisoli]|uniref:Lysozyme inhibitor LprI N-terminal domain-containing protein n=1 Tax=Sphingomonas panacisoli TaxID=1813879 RepID=A0A5B8LH76_9SPHN|nr:hypothetical protein [Sphingomonas panacisoli]QDZ07199.1 hypothetical protein FPZ24_06660 [Sphingomonas panacisoli]
MRYLLTIAGLLGAATALPVHAEKEVDRAAIAECVVDNDIKDVRTLLNTLPGSPEERKAGDRIMVYYGGCNDNKVMAGQIAWRERAEIADAALRSRFGGKQFDAASPARDGWKLAVAGKTAGTDYDAGSASMRQFGDCVVAVAPGAAVRLAQSSRKSDEETAAIAALAPTLNDCIAPGQNFKVKRADLRLIVAEPLYHMMAK